MTDDNGYEHDVVGLTGMLWMLRRNFPQRASGLLADDSHEGPEYWPEDVTEQAHVLTRAVCEALRATDDGAAP